SVTLCCATDGNHGRSVAFAARQLGCKAVVYVHEQVSPVKAAAIEALGARVERVPGTYDDAVRRARSAAAERNWLLVQDKSTDPLDETTLLVMQGYTVMVLEILEQLADQPLPTHVFLQAGVGGLAGAIAGALADMLGERRPMIVVVEPEAAAC